MGPIDYSLNVDTPFKAAMQGYQAGAAIRDDQAQQVALQAQKTAAQQQQQMLNQLANNPNATGSDYARVMTMIPGAAEPLTKAWAARNTDQQQSMLTDLSTWGSAIKNGQPQIAADAMTARADAMEKAAGAPTPESQALRANAQIVLAAPTFALGVIQAKLGAHPDGSKVATTLAALGKEEREAAAAPVDLAIKTAESKIKGAEAAAAPLKIATDIAKTAAETDNLAKRFALDRDKLTSEIQLELEKLKQKNGELPEFIVKDINEATTSAIASAQSATKMTDLATRLEAEGGGFGAASTVSEWLKKATGNQNEITRLRAEFNRIATPAAMAAYKKVAAGSTSDKDIETAMIGVPKDNADAATLASFLRGAAKLQIYDSVLSNAKSEWLGAVRSLGKAKADIEIDGVRVPAGATFKTFIEEYVPRKVGEKTTVSTILASPYAEFAAPVVPAAPVAPMVPGGN